MLAELLLDERHQIRVDAFVALRIWRVPSPVRGSSHAYKYSLAYVVGGINVLRYDNEAGKATIGTWVRRKKFTGSRRQHRFLPISGAM